MRKLATIRQISEIKSIEGADLIEVVTVDGWQVVVAKKDNFKVGQNVLYFEIDSFLPERPEFEFLRKNCLRKLDGVEGFRLKTIRLRGQISQGLVMPIDCFEELKNSKLGDDVTGKLKVKLYEATDNSKPIKLTKIQEYMNTIYDLLYRVSPRLAKFVKFHIFNKFNVRHNSKFPSFLHKTDQPRVQNLSSKLEELSKVTYEVTVKIDGSSMTVYKYGKKTGVCSRNQQIDRKDKNNKYNMAEQKYDIINKLNKVGGDIAICGELYGEGIQKNPEGIEGIDFAVFDIYDTRTSLYVTPMECAMICENLGLKHVPVLHKDFSIEGMGVQDILEMAEGKSLVGKRTVNREGIVFKSTEMSENGHYPHFKAISNSYLLKDKG